MGSKPLAMFSYLSGGYGLSKSVSLEYFQILGVLWSCSTQKPHRSLSFVCCFSSACTGMGREGLTSSAGLGDFMARVCSDLWGSAFRQEQQDTCVLWQCVPCGMLVRWQKNPPFLRSSGVGGTHFFGHKDSSESSCQLEQQHQKHMENVRICAV